MSQASWAADHRGPPSRGPLVSCLLPTRDRPRFVSQAIAYFARQDYPERELVIVDDGEESVAGLVAGQAPFGARVRYHRLDRPLPLGAKRNLACGLGQGELLAHWDDDDWYAPWRLSYQVIGLLDSGLPVSGASRLLFYAPARRQAWLYARRVAPRWIAGSTLLYTREHWLRNRFAEVDAGEDTLFASADPALWAHQPADHRFCVGIVHGANAAPKITSDRWWEPVRLSQVLDLLGADQDFYATLPPPSQGPAAGRELVSCITPTADRRTFLRQAVRYFLAQDYPARELIIVDDGRDPCGDLATDERVRYVRVDPGRSIGAKRNLACSLARGQVIVQWDDDDWHGPHRLSHQVADILARRADLTGLDQGTILDLPNGQFWSCRDELHARMFFQSHSIHGGTLAFRKEVWARCGGYPDESLAEDAHFMSRAILHGARVSRLPNDSSFIYVRHGGNAWQFTCGDFGGARGWCRVAPPAFLPPEDLAFYEGLRSAMSAIADPEQGVRPHALRRR
jgi:O-antigen biosynthesis protein